VIYLILEGFKWLLGGITALLGLVAALILLGWIGRGTSRLYRKIRERLAETPEDKTVRRIHNEFRAKYGKPDRGPAMSPEMLQKLIIGVTTVAAVTLLKLAISQALG
jgi:hypothetical protein